MCWQPFHRKQCMAYALPYYENEHQLSVNNLWSCILGYQGIAPIFERITELLTGFLGKNITYERKTTHSIIIDIAPCKTCKKSLLVADCVILIRYYHQTAKTTALYESTNGPAGWPADNPPKSDGFGYLHWTVSELTVRVFWQPGPSIWQWLGSDLDPDPKRRSGTVANTSLVVSPTNSLDRTYGILRNGLIIITHLYDSAQRSSSCVQFEHMSGNRGAQNCRCVDESGRIWTEDRVGTLVSANSWSCMGSIWVCWW